MSNTKSIFQRINEVQKAVKYVQKDATITGGGTYKAVTHDQVIAVVREAVVDAGILIVPEQLTGEFKQLRDVKAEIKQHLYTGAYAVHFINVDNGEDRLTITVEAHANDSGDKAPGKAITYATKTAILKVFLLETGVNDESRVESSRGYTAEQKERFDEIIESKDAMALLEFSAMVGDEVYTNLYNSGGTGKKVKLKAACTDLIKDANAKIDEYVAKITDGVAREDVDAVLELVEELTPFESKLAAARMERDVIDTIKAMKSAAGI